MAIGTSLHAALRNMKVRFPPCRIQSVIPPDAAGLKNLIIRNAKSGEFAIVDSEKACGFIFNMLEGKRFRFTDLIEIYPETRDYYQIASEGNYIHM
ncbi:Hypothetical protein POVR1_LOCUS443 [uncultured virus]|nr:Hypothetical protein POVR1_LOCUS443 [uncultured virus]